MKVEAIKSGTSFQYRIRGNVTLTYALSTIGGMAFLGLFFNLATYVSTQSALEAAARAAARCLSPTDGICANPPDVGNHFNPVPPHWWGINTAGNTTESITMFQEIVRYQGSMNQRTYYPSFTTYQVRRHQPEIQFTTYSLPLRRFEPVLTVTPNTATATIDNQSLIFRPVADGFPGRDNDTTSTWNSWRSAQNPPFAEALNDTRTIAPGASELFQATISIPALDPRAATAQCLDSSNQPCDIGPLAGGPSDQNAWHQTAYVALKVLAEVRAQNSTARVKWGRDSAIPQERPALWADIYDASGALLETVCLGGRVYSGDIDTNTTGYNLWTRGPVGANGGPEGNASCPGGKVLHDNIAVPRGGSLVVQAHLKAHTSFDAAIANVTIAAFYDNYVSEVSSSTVVCENIPMNPETGECDVSSCRLGFDWTILSCAEEQVGSAASSAFTVDPTTTSLSYDAAVCDPNWQIDPYSEAETNQVFSDLYSELDTLRTRYPYASVQTTSWTTQDLGTVRVIDVPSSCQTASPHTQSYTCQDVVFGEITQTADCDGFHAHLSEYETSTNSLNRSQRELSAVQFPTAINARIVEGPERWTTSWIPIELPEGVNANSALRLQSHSLNESRLAISVFQALDNSWPDINSNHFIEAIAESGMLSNAEGWNEFAANASAYIDVETVDSTISFNSVAPFDSERPKVYTGDNFPTPVYDFDLDCSADTRCSTFNSAYSSLEEYLRQSAAQIVPEAATQSAGQYLFAFSWQETPVRIEQFGPMQYGDRHQAIWESCPMVVSRCQRTVTEGADEQYLGQSHDEPQGCQDGTFSFCRREVPHLPASTNYEQNDSNSLGENSIAMAKQVALNEIQQIVGGAQLAEHCSDSGAGGCTEIQIDNSDPQRIQVSISFNMPISFPLDSIRGDSTLRLGVRKEETLEVSTLR